MMRNLCVCIAARAKQTNLHYANHTHETCTRGVNAIMGQATDEIRKQTHTWKIHACLAQAILVPDQVLI